MKKILSLVALLAFSSCVFASPIKHLVFFGDSMSDNGNLYQLIRTMPKSPPYYKGRFTNGPTWAESLERYFYNHEYIDSRNYAYGGATAILHSFITDRIALPITLNAEMYEYDIGSFNEDKDDTLFTLWIGANDYLFETQPDMDALTTDVTNSISDAIKELIGKGGQYFLVINLPDLSRTPYATNNGLVDRLHTLAVMHNQKLASAIAAIRAENPSIKIAFLDVFTEFNGIVDNPEIYNHTYHLTINNTTEACWLGAETFQAMHNNKLLENKLSQDISADLAKNMKDSKFVDVQSITHFILNSPDLFQAYEVNKSHDEGMRPCADASNYLFWDDVHPTYEIHKVVTKLAVDRLSEAGILP